MKVSGFTFVKNAVKYSYPVVESIRSVLPVVDEMIVCLGDSEDDTDALIGSIGSDKIRIIHSVWDKTITEGGKVLAVETNKAKDSVADDSDWLFYIQADEVVHEQYHPVIRAAMEQYLNDSRVEGLLFHYHHFYGSYGYIADSRKWYSKEIRVIRNNSDIRSYLDAQGFRWKDDRKLQVKLIDAWIYHYGWVRNPVKMQQKWVDIGMLWAGNPTEEQIRKANALREDRFDYTNIDSVTRFEGTHPAVMRERVAAEDWQPEIDEKKKHFKNIKHRFLYFLWKQWGIRLFEYRNYIKL